MEMICLMIWIEMNRSDIRQRGIAITPASDSGLVVESEQPFVLIEEPEPPTNTLRHVVIPMILVTVALALTVYTTVLVR